MNNDNDNNNKELQRKPRRVTRFYMILSVISVVIMIGAAYITHGYQIREITASYKPVREIERVAAASIGVSADLSRVPSDDVIEDILNDVVPDACGDCDDSDPLDCLDEYEIDKVLIQEAPFQNQLFIDLITGKSEKKYTVAIDLSDNNRVIYHDGKIDKKICLEFSEEEGLDPEVHIDKGKDPDATGYINVPPPS